MHTFFSLFEVCATLPFKHPSSYLVWFPSSWTRWSKSSYDRCPPRRQWWLPTTPGRAAHSWSYKIIRFLAPMKKEIREQDCKYIVRQLAWANPQNDKKSDPSLNRQSNLVSSDMTNDSDVVTRFCLWFMAVVCHYKHEMPRPKCESSSFVVVNTNLNSNS